MQKFETSFAFPLIKMNTLITYTEVEKPTGISYFLLVLINEYSDKSVKISHLLKQFGVPNDLHELFADEIQTLLKAEIITTEHNYNKSYFQEYPLGKFQFTMKGKKVFLDEAIPSNINKTLKQVVYYNPALNQLALTVDRDYGNINGSVLGEPFFKQFSYPDNDLLEEYYGAKKGNGLSIKKEEIILSAYLQSIDYNFITYPVTILIEDNDQISFEFEDVKLKTFFEKHYTKEMIKDLIQVKNKFKFTVPETIQTKLSTVAQYKQIYLPEIIKQKLNEKSLIDVNLDRYPTNNAKLTYTSNSILANINPAFAFVKMVDLNHAYGYIPAGITLNSDIFGPIQLKLLIEIALDNPQVGAILGDIVAQYKVFIYDDNEPWNYKSLLLLCKMSNSLELIHSKIDYWIKDLSKDGQITVLGRVKDKSINEPLVYEYIKKKGLSLFESYFNDINIDNLENKLTNSSWIQKANKLSDIQVLESLFNKIDISRKNKIKLYNLLETLGYQTEDILTFMQDMIVDIINDSTTSNGLSKLKMTLDNALKSLQSITGIKDPHNYAMKDVIQKMDFIDHYKVFSESFKGLSFIEKYNKELFTVYKDFDRLFLNLNDLFVTEKNALGNPKAINEKLIDSKINAGDFLGAVTNLYVKLSSICKSKFNIDGDFIQMIQRLEKKDYINKEETAVLHQFRQYRNDLEHANEIKKALDKKDLLAVKSIVFKLEGMRI